MVGWIDIHTRVDTIRPQILMWDLKNRRKVALAKWPTMTGELPK